MREARDRSKKSSRTSHLSTKCRPSSARSRRVREQLIGSDSKRNIVVELLAARAPAATRLLGVGRRRPRRDGRARGGPGRGTGAAAEHLQLVADDLGRVALVALLVLPLARPQAPFDVDLRALAQIFAGDLGQAAEERDAVPLGALLLLAGLLIAPALAGRDAQVGHRRARGHG